MKTTLLDTNVYDKLGSDPQARGCIRTAVEDGRIRIIATPIVIDELARSPFRGLPDWFPI